jgi:redox-regulated HSP33 family molecular chaperone
VNVSPFTHSFNCSPSYFAENAGKFLLQRIHLRNEAKTTTLEKLVPHLGTLEATKSQLHEVRELARKTEHDLRNRISELQESNYELSGSSKGKYHIRLTYS